MVPILYSRSEIQFLSNGLGRLVDCISCEVTEERNGIYECEFTYPVTGRFYDYMRLGGTICVVHDDKKDRQPFDIYKHSTPINGIVTFNARHISYRLNGITVNPYTAYSCVTAIEGIGTHSMQTNPFTFWTDKSVSATFKLETPASARGLLAGSQGSLLDVYGKGEYEFDKFTVKLHLNRGANNHVAIRYGKNLTDYTLVYDEGQYYNAVSPFWKGEDGTVVMLPEGYVQSPDVSGDVVCIPLDLSSDFEDAPTEAELRARAYKYLEDNEPYYIDENITLDFVQLWQTEDYKDYAPLERISLCDTVYIYFNGRRHIAKVIKVVYDALRERYVSMELGKAQTTLQQAILQPYQKELQDVEAIAKQKVSNSELAAAIDAATQLITGATGGHVVINTNANGEPEEILIMDTDDKATAVNVWRFNLNGLAHSSTGYNGPFADIALTADGKINANMILTGYLVANIIKGGTLTLGGANNGNGTLELLDANGNVVGVLNNSGASLSGSVESTYNGTHARITGGYFELVDGNTLICKIYRFTNGGTVLSVTDALGNETINLNGNQSHAEIKSAAGRVRTAMYEDGLYVYYDDYDAHIAGKIGIDYWTGQAFLQLNSTSGNDDIYLIPGVGLRIGSTTMSESQLQQLLALI